MALPCAAWVSWFVNAAMRASPVPVGAVGGDGLRAIRNALADAPYETPERRSGVKGLGGLVRITGWPGREARVG